MLFYQKTFHTSKYFLFTNSLTIFLLKHCPNGFFFLILQKILD